jgi:hypothetical protein
MLVSGVVQVSRVLCMCHACVSVMFQSRFSHVLGVCGLPQAQLSIRYGSCAGPASKRPSQQCHVLAMCWPCAGHVLAMCGPCDPAAAAQSSRHVAYYKHKARQPQPQHVLAHLLRRPSGLAGASPSSGPALARRAPAAPPLSSDCVRPTSTGP